MQDKYPVVKLDRATMQEFLPILMNKGIFTNYFSLPTKDEILEEAKAMYGVDSMTYEQKREVLAKAGQYRTNHLVVRDYGDYAIAFNPVVFEDYLSKVEADLEVLKLSKKDMDISNALKRIRLYKMAHRLVIVILATAYANGTYSQLEVSKQSLVEVLGYSTANKQVYEDISDVIFTLMTLTYRIYRYKSKLKLEEQELTIGTFIYNMTEDSKRFILDINPKFAGCVMNFLNKKNKNAREVYKRGYLSYPTSLIPATRNYSTAAYLLAHFLITEQGNSKLKGKGVKVVSFKIKRYMEVMNIKASRPSKRKAEFLEALKEVEIIHDQNLSFSDLTNIIPSELEEAVLRLTIIDPVKDLDGYIKSNLLGVR
jgi:hypothetical protein